MNNQQIPLYFMGVDALTAERDTLLKRKGDDFTEPRVAKIQQELKQLENNREVQYRRLERARSVSSKTSTSCVESRRVYRP